MQEFVEAGNDASIQAVELRAAEFVHLGIRAEWPEQTGGERRIDAFEELEEEQTYRVSLREQSIATGARDLFNQTLGSEFGEIVAERRKSVFGLAAAQSLGGWNVKF